MPHDQPATTWLLLLIALFVQLCFTLISASAIRPPVSSSSSAGAAHAHYDFTEHVGQEHENPSEGIIHVVRRYNLRSQCSGKLVQITGKHVNARGNPLAKHGPVLRFQTVNFNGVVRIQSEKSRDFLCFNKKGRLVVRHNGDSELCQFREESQEDGAYQFRAVVNREWLVGFRKNGKRAPGDRWARRRRHRGKRRGKDGKRKHARRPHPRVNPCYRFNKVHHNEYVDRRLHDRQKDLKPGHFNQLKAHIQFETGT